MYDLFITSFFAMLGRLDVLTIGVSRYVISGGVYFGSV